MQNRDTTKYITYFFNYFTIQYIHDGLPIIRSCWIILVSCVESIVELAAFIVYGTSRTDCRILFIDVTTRYQLAKRLIVCSILSAYRPDWVVSSTWIRTVILQVHNLEVACHRVIKRHRVTHITNSWLVISALCCLVGRTDYLLPCNSIHQYIDYFL